MRHQSGQRRILVTGGGGFVGRRVIARLLAAGCAVRVLDLRPLDLPEGCEAVAGDIAAPGTVLAAAEGCEGIVHLAGLMTVDCARDPLRAVQVNLTGSLQVFEAARATGAKVAWLSTSGVFGPEDAAHPHPMTIYGALKLAVEGIARAYHADHGVPSLALRPYIVYGPGESAGIAAGPSIALRAAVERRPATIRFSGRVGFVHVDDVARALTSAVTGPMTGCTALTMAGETAEVTAFTARLTAATGWNGITIEGRPLRIPADLASDPMPAWLGPQPVTGLDQGIAQSLAELRAAQAAATE